MCSENVGLPHKVVLIIKIITLEPTKFYDLKKQGFRKLFLKQADFFSYGFISPITGKSVSRQGINIVT